MLHFPHRACCSNPLRGISIEASDFDVGSKKAATSGVGIGSGGPTEQLSPVKRCRILGSESSIDCGKKAILILARGSGSDESNNQMADERDVISNNVDGVRAFQSTLEHR